MAMAEPATRARGYTLVLPPGWARIPLREGTDGVVADILDRSFAGLPADRFGPVRSELEKRLRRQTRAARDAGGLDLYLPIERVHGVTIAASFVVAEVSFDDDHGVQARVAAALVAQEEGARLVEVDGVTGVRTERVAGPAGREEQGEDDVPESRRVEYTVPVPGDPRRWLAIGFSTLAPRESPHGDLGGLLVDLFDALMSTFRWTTGADRNER